MLQRNHQISEDIVTDNWFILKEFKRIEVYSAFQSLKYLLISKGATLS